MEFFWYFILHKTAPQGYTLARNESRRQNRLSLTLEFASEILSCVKAMFGVLIFDYTILA